MGETPLSRDETASAAAGWSGETPLWLYVLSEVAAAATASGSDPSAAGSSPRS